MRSEIRSLITSAVDVLLQERSIDSGEIPLWSLERTKQKDHGDFASNVALVLAKSLGSKPRDLAQAVLERLPAAVWITRTEIAGPGFINFYLSPAAYFRPIPPDPYTSVTGVVPLMVTPWHGFCEPRGMTPRASTTLMTRGGRWIFWR